MAKKSGKGSGGGRDAEGLLLGDGSDGVAGAPDPNQPHHGGLEESGWAVTINGSSVHSTDGPTDAQSERARPPVPGGSTLSRQNLDQGRPGGGRRSRSRDPSSRGGGNESVEMVTGGAPASTVEDNERAGGPQTRSIHQIMKPLRLDRPEILRYSLVGWR